MSQNVRIGIIGLGGMAAAHAKGILDGKAGKRCTLLAACDTSEERLAWAKENLSADLQTFASADELMQSKTVTDGYVLTDLVQLLTVIRNQIRTRAVGILSDRVNPAAGKDSRRAKINLVAYNTPLGR